MIVKHDCLFESRQTRKFSSDLINKCQYNQRVMSRWSKIMSTYSRMMSKYHHSKYNDTFCLIDLSSLKLRCIFCFRAILWQSQELCQFKINSTRIMSLTISDIYLMLFLFFYKCDNFLRIVLHSWLSIISFQ